VRTREILEGLYGIRERRRFWLPGALDRVRSDALDWVEDHNWQLIGASLITAVWVATHIYYYNQLVMYEFGVKVTWAQVETARQKRSHIQENLAQALRYYAKYERDLMIGVTELRAEGDPVTKKPPTGDKASIAGLLGRFRAVAEQYPNPALMQSVTTFSTAVVESERQIALRIMEYNNAVNVYTTLLNTFPSRVFAATMGFEGYPFYKPKDERVLEYKKVDL